MERLPKGICSPARYARCGEVTSIANINFLKGRVLTVKSLRVVATALAVILCIGVATAVPPPSYPLRVRGGKLYLRTEGTNTSGLVKLIVEFSPGSERADAGLRPGQGSWLDRGMRQGEPNRLEYFMQSADARNVTNYLRRQDAYYVFECFNTGKGYFQVTKAYPKTVRID